MPSLNTSGAPEVVKDLAEAFSGQSKLSNRLWIALIAVTFVIILPVPLGNSPVPLGNSGESYRELPFGFGHVESNDFDLISLVILAVLTIAFCQAHAQAIRAYRLAQKIINRPELARTESMVSARQFFDLLTIPSLTRVAPLAQLLLKSAQNLSRYRCLSFSALNWLASIYFLILKFVATLIIFGLPATALVIGCQRLFNNQSVSMWTYAAAATGLVALLALVQITVTEFCQTVRLARRFQENEVRP